MKLDYTQIPPGDRIVRVNDIASHFGISRAQVYILKNAGELPPSIQVSPRVSGIPIGWLNAFIQALADKALEQ